MRPIVVGLALVLTQFAHGFFGLANTIHAQENLGDGSEYSVADSGYKITQMFGDGRTFATPYGSFIHPTTKNYFVTNCAKMEVFEFNPKGVLQNRWSNLGSDSGELNFPADLAYDPHTDRIVVVDELNNRFQIFSSDGKYLSEVGEWGVGKAQFQNPLGVAINSKSQIYIVDWRNYRVQVFDKNGEFLFMFGEFNQPGQPVGQGRFKSPYYIEIDSEDNVYVGDRGNHNIQKFRPDGTWIKQWGEKGSGNGQLNYPHEIAVDKYDNIYVADTYNSRIQVFDKEGNFLNIIGDKSVFTVPKTVAVDDVGNVYTTDVLPVGGAVQKWTRGEPTEQRTADNKSPDLKHFPKKLSEFGIDVFSNLQTREEYHYVPNYPSYAPYISKHRVASFPSGGHVKFERGSENYPVGSLWFKTFNYTSRSLPTICASVNCKDNQPKPIETRVIKKISEFQFDYAYATYIWDADGREANIKEENSPETLIIEDYGLIGYTVPSQKQCTQCHKHLERPSLNGFVGFQLSITDEKGNLRETQIDHRSILKQLAVLTPDDSDSLANDFSTSFGHYKWPEMVGNVFANCVHCHDGKRKESYLPDVFPIEFFDKTNRLGEQYLKPVHDQQLSLFQEVLISKRMPPIGTTVDNGLYRLVTKFATDEHDRYDDDAILAAEQRILENIAASHSKTKQTVYPQTHAEKLASLPEFSSDGLLFLETEANLLADSKPVGFLTEGWNISPDLRAEEVASISGDGFKAIKFTANKQPNSPLTVARLLPNQSSHAKSNQRSLFSFESLLNVFSSFKTPNEEGLHDNLKTYTLMIDVEGLGTDVTSFNLFDYDNGAYVAAADFDFATGEAKLMNTEKSEHATTGAVQLADRGPNGGVVYRVWITAQPKSDVGRLAVYLLPVGSNGFGSSSIIHASYAVDGLVMLN